MLSKMICFLFSTNYLEFFYHLSRLARGQHERSGHRIVLPHLPLLEDQRFTNAQKSQGGISEWKAKDKEKNEPSKD